MRAGGSPHKPPAWLGPTAVAPPPPPPPPPPGPGWNPNNLIVGTFSHAAGVHGSGTDLTDFRSRSGLQALINHVYEGPGVLNGNLPGAIGKLAMTTNGVVVQQTHLWGGAAKAFYGMPTLDDMRIKQGTQAQWMANPQWFTADALWFEHVVAGGISTLCQAWGAAYAALPQADRRRLRIGPIHHENTMSYHRGGVPWGWPNLPAGVAKTAGDRIAAAWGPAFDQIVADIRLGAGSAAADLKFYWSLAGNIGSASGQAIATAIQPSVGSYDVITFNDYADHKDNEWPPGNSVTNNNNAWNWLIPFARAKGKPIGMNEIGQITRWQSANDYDADALAFHTNNSARAKAHFNDTTSFGLAWLLHFEKDKGFVAVGQPGGGENMCGRVVMDRVGPLSFRQTAASDVTFPNGDVVRSNYPATSIGMTTLYR